MSDLLYRRLQEHLDSLPVGFPKTDSGVEIAILKKIFLPEEAELVLHLNHIPETVESISQRTGLDPESTGQILERMAGKGQVFRMRKDGKTFYNAAVWLPGIWEFQLNNVDSELARMFEEFFAEHTKEFTAGRFPLYRVIPVQETISTQMKVMPYDKVKELIRSQKTIALADCLCRKEKRLTGYICKHITETCLLFSHVGQYYVDNGLARLISVDEALEVLERSERDGLVHSPHNAQHPMSLCNCCGCCCALLRGITQLNLPASRVIRSDFYAECDSEECTGCGECIERCQVLAINLEQGMAQVDLNRCIGCGICVSACPAEALTLKHKTPEDLADMPVSLGEAFNRLAADKVAIRKG